MALILLLRQQRSGARLNDFGCAAAYPRFVTVSYRSRESRCPAGFSLIELLVVMAIVGLLVALLLPAVQGSREAARRLECNHRLRQIGLALHSYHETHEAFPPGCQDCRKYRHSWATMILPQLEELTVWDAYDLEHASRSEANRAATTTVVSAYLCPSTMRRMWDRPDDTVGDKFGNGRYDPGDDMACTDYGGMFGDGRPGGEFASGVMIWDKPIAIRQILDGTSHTIVITEDTGRGWVSDGEWANGENIFDVTRQVNQVQHNEIWSDHPEGSYALLADGSVRLLDVTTELTVLTALCTRAGGEAVSRGTP